LQLVKYLNMGQDFVASENFSEPSVFVIFTSNLL
jgi:hypothetical protein